MNFVRSRIALVGLVVAWPLAQLVGCTATERDYDPPTGEGGDGATTGGSDGSGGTTGGTGGSKGGSSGKAGSSSGSSAGGDSGSGGDAGGGTDSSGGTSGSSATGGSSSGGSSGTEAGGGGSDPGSGGTSGTSGTAGMGGTVDPGCVATGGEVCDDGLDNDCDGTTDCLVGVTQFPLVNGAAAGTDVAYGFEVPATGATFQCRVTHGDTPAGSFKACAGGVVESESPALRTVYPFDLATASDPLNDGYWTTEVRLRFPSGATSDSVRRSVYIHSSLVGEARCDELASTEAWAAAAAAHLPDAGAIVAVTVRNPFVQIAFDPPVNARHSVGADDGLVKWRSLRRQFDFSADKHYLVMTRTYTSRADAGMGCYAARKRIHHLRGTSLAVTSTNPIMTYQDCQAVVFNKAGAGYCLDYLAGSIVSVAFERAATRAYWNSTGAGTGSYSYPTNTLDAGYAPDADNLLWRKLTARIRPILGGYMSNFSAKCDEEGCAAADTTGYTLYLPDKQYFGYWE